MPRKPFDDVALVLSPTDNVAVLRRPVFQADELVGHGIHLTVLQDLPVGHKLALKALEPGVVVRKYGQPIGVARHVIRPGEHVHTHNLDLPPATVSASVPPAPQPVVAPAEARTFPGYLRPDGRVGTRNYLAVIASVNCSASVCRQVRDAFPPSLLERDFPGVDGIVALTHEGGCGMDAGEPRDLLQRVMVGMARHPNVAGCVFIGLGCEVNQLDPLRQGCAARPVRNPNTPAPAAFFQIQSAGGSRKTVAAATAALHRMLQAANQLRRTPQPVRSLVLAENCGGSDAASGITANPALGLASDLLIRHGGTSVLAETPEIYGAERLLTARAVSPAVADQLLDRIRWWEEYVRRHQSSLDNNPSPGNKAGGISNIVEKSLGAVAKGGTAPLAAVYRYAEPISTPGLCFMDTPGYDPVSMTGLVAGGCNVAVFTTGRGSVYGCKPTPCIKVASNSDLFRHMEDDMDLNAGTILDGTTTLAEVGQAIFEKIIAVAGGEKTKSELAGMGDEEFVPWRLGPTL